MGRIAWVCKAIVCGLFGKGQIAIIDEQFALFIVALYIPRITHINIQQAIGIDVYHGYPGCPSFFACYTRRSCYVFKGKVALIDIKSIGQLIGRKINIQKSIVIYIPKSHSASVVIISVFVHIEIIGKI